MTASGITAVAVVSGLLIADIVFGVVVTYSKNLCKNVVDEGYDNTAYGDGWNDGYNEGAEDAGIDTEDAVNAAYENGTQFGLEAGFAEGLAAGLALNLLANDTLLEILNEAYSKVEEAYTEGYELGYEECIADYDNGFYNFDDLEVGDVIVFDIESYDPNEVLDDENDIIEGDVDDSEDEDEIDADVDACGDLGCPICNSDDDEFDDYDNDLSAENDQVEESSEADAVALANDLNAAIGYEGMQRIYSLFIDNPDRAKLFSQLTHNGSLGFDGRNQSQIGVVYITPTGELRGDGFKVA